MHHPKFSHDLWSISPTFYERICANILAPKSSNLECNYKKSWRKNFVQKSRALNVGEIDTCKESKTLGRHSS
jgi:hypothetical protein